jgi:hypothetical protein
MMPCYQQGGPNNDSFVLQFKVTKLLSKEMSYPLSLLLKKPPVQQQQQWCWWQHM